MNEAELPSHPITATLETLPLPVVATCITITSALLVCNAFLGVLAHRRHGIGTWLGAFVSGWLIHATATPLYKNINQNYGLLWWAVTVLGVGIILVLHGVGKRLLNGSYPNAAITLVAPIAGIGAAAVHAWLSLQLSTFTGGWKEILAVLIFATFTGGISRYSED